MSTSRKNPPMPSDEALRALHSLVRNLRKLGYTDSEITEYMRRNFPPRPRSRESGPNARTFPSIDQIRETPEGGPMPE